MTDRVDWPRAKNLVLENRSEFDRMTMEMIVEGLFIKEMWRDGMFTPGGVKMSEHEHQTTVEQDLILRSRELSDEFLLFTKTGAHDISVKATSCRLVCDFLREVAEYLEPYKEGRPECPGPSP